jgi:HSP20 family molecular chaperone IbpA
MVTSLFDVFFDSDFYSFNRLVRDKRPYQVVNNEGSSTIIHGIVGINPEDVKIEIKPIDDRHSYIVISGETKDELLEEEIYKIQSRFTVKHNDVDKITKKVKNGILYLTVKWKQQEKPQIQILEE